MPAATCRKAGEDKAVRPLLGRRPTGSPCEEAGSRAVHDHRKEGWGLGRPAMQRLRGAQWLFPYTTQKCQAAEIVGFLAREELRPSVAGCYALAPRLADVVYELPEGWIVTKVRY